MTDVDARDQIDSHQRFAFGENWRKFLDLVDDDRIRAAEESLQEKLGDVSGKSFLDIGSGSGLLSLAARNLGASVSSFDFDPQSVACAHELRRRYRAEDIAWKIEQGSALDSAYLKELGLFDIVYSWGVLHHTGDMWTALGFACERVAPGGRLYIAIYNDQGRSSRNWKAVKQAYTHGGPVVRRAIILGAQLKFWSDTWDIPARLYRAVRRLPAPQGHQTRGRGMDPRRDLIDWVGGWPFEVATPDSVFLFCTERGFELSRLKTCAGGIGCNEFVFLKRRN